MNEKQQAKAVILEDIHPYARELFTEAGVEVETFAKDVSHDELADKLQGAQFLGVRSGPTISGEAIRVANNLVGIGCYCVGTSHIDKQVATEQNVAVFNAPFDNGRSVAQLVIGATYSLFRRLHEHNSNLHAGAWSKTEAHSFELTGKTMGVLGYGNIGQQVGDLAEANGMNVIYYDNVERAPRGCAEPRGKRALLEEADVVTVHIPGGLGGPAIGAEELTAMKNEAYLINAARAEAVDYQALASRLRQNKLAGAALDVFFDEPKKRGHHFVSEFQGDQRVLLTPHIGGSTLEAQRSAAETVTNAMLKHWRAGMARGGTMGRDSLQY